MRQTFTFKHLWIPIIALAISMNYAFTEGIKSNKDTTYLHLLKSRQAKNTFKNGLHLVLPPIRPAVISTTKVSVYKPDDKLLNNVQVYPNPVTDQVNLKYELSRNASVTIKILDVLGTKLLHLSRSG